MLSPRSRVVICNVMPPYLYTTPPMDSARKLLYSAEWKGCAFVFECFIEKVGKRDELDSMLSKHS